MLYELGGEKIQVGSADVRLDKKKGGGGRQEIAGYVYLAAALSAFRLPLAVGALHITIASSTSNSSRLG